MDLGEALAWAEDTGGACARLASAALDPASDPEAAAAARQAGLPNAFIDVVLPLDYEGYLGTWRTATPRELGLLSNEDAV